MDEPTARLAPAERTPLFAIMRRMAARGVGIVYISHFLEEVIEVADTVTVLRDGRVVASGPAAGHTVESLAALLVGEAEVAESGPRRTAGAGQAVLTADRLTLAGRPPVSLSLRAGEIVGLAGLVGSGRTHLARAIIGDVHAGGTVSLAGRPLPYLTPTRAADVGILMLPEDRKVSGLVMTSSVSENIALTGFGRLLSRLGLVRRGAQRTLVAEMLQRFRILPADPARAVGTLSGGNAQKVLLARAVAARPRVLLLDQPTAGVDVGAKAELHRQIQALAAEGAAILLISDDLDEMLELSDRILVMTQGAVTDALPTQRADRAALLAAISRGAERAAA
jgi:ABC-type sugar transport system ATPase subunit